MKKWKLTNNGRTMFWVFYSQNGLNWLESDKGDYIKVKNLSHAEEIIANLTYWDIEVLYDYTNK